MNARPPRETLFLAKKSLFYTHTCVGTQEHIQKIANLQKFHHQK